MKESKSLGQFWELVLSTVFSELGLRNILRLSSPAARPWGVLSGWRADTLLCLLPDEGVICVLQDLPVALLLGQRLGVSELAKSKAKTPSECLCSRSSVPCFGNSFFHLGLPFVLFRFVGQCFTAWASVFNVTIFGYKYVFT